MNYEPLLLLTGITLVVIFIPLCFFAVRNEVTLKVRRAFINDDLLYPSAYLTLPSYDAMLLNPRYYLLWTKDQWVRKVAV